ncbi:MAG TPA: hypothetical protein VGL59_16390, partial [Polyangia bacterium]
GAPLRGQADLVTGIYRPATLNPEVLAALPLDGRRLAALIGQLTEPDPARRPPSAAAALAALS